LKENNAALWKKVQELEGQIAQPRSNAKQISQPNSSGFTTLKSISESTGYGMAGFGSRLGMK
jgi:hypothetical protein